MWGWLKTALGGIADVAVTAVCTAICPFGGEFIGGYLGGAVNGLINGDSAGEAFSTDGFLGMAGAGVGGLASRLIAKGVEKGAAKGLKDVLGKDILGNNKFGFADTPGRLDVWNSALSPKAQAIRIGARSGFRGAGGATVVDIFTQHGRQNLGIGGSDSSVSGSGQDGTGEAQAIAGSTQLTWFPSAGTTAITGVQDHPGATGAKATLLIPKNYTTNAAMTSAYQQFGSTLSSAWENAGTISSATPSTPPAAST